MPAPQRSVTAALLSCTGILLLTAAPAALADYTNTAVRASVNYLYNDNPTLRPQQFARASTSYIEGQVRGIGEWATDSQSADISGRIVRSWYTQEENKDLNQTNFYVNGSASQSFELSSLGISAGYSNVGVLSDEIGTGNDLPGGGSGNTLRADDKVFRYNVAPFYVIRFSEKDQIDFRLSYNRTDYELDFTGRAPNKTLTASTSYQRTINRRLGLGVTINGNNFRSSRNLLIPDPNDIPNLEEVNLANKNKSIGATLDVNYLWSEQTALTARFGRTNTTATSQFVSDDANTPDIDIEVTETDIKNTLYSIQLDHTGRRNIWMVALSRTIVPNSEGNETTRNSFDFEFNRRLTQRMSFNVRGLAFDQEAISAVGQLNAVNKYKFATVTSSLAWSYTRRLDFSASYSYRWNERNNLAAVSSTAKSNQIGIGVIYNWD